MAEHSLTYLNIITLDNTHRCALNLCTAETCNVHFFQKLTITNLQTISLHAGSHQLPRVGTVNLFTKHCSFVCFKNCLG